MDWRGFVYNRNMYFVYILKNIKGSIYIGFSSDVFARLKKHNSGGSKFTSDGRPWELVYYEAFKSEYDARVREKTLKEYGSSLGQLKKRISKSLEV